MEWTQNAKLKLMTFNCDLVLSQHGLVISSAHHLCQGNISFNFHKNPFWDKEDMERTHNKRLKLVTSDCDRDLESAWFSYKFCTPSLSGEHLIKIS